MKNAEKFPCEIIMNPKDEKYAESIRKFQGCPTVAVSKKGRIFAGWFAGGICEPDMDNYNLLVYSDDEGKSWSEPVFVIPSSKENNVHAFDIQLWIDPDGRLHVYWVQNEVKPADEKYCTPEHFNKTGFWTDEKEWCVRGYCFSQCDHVLWTMVCENPDENLSFSKPECLGLTFLRNKPLVMDDGTWLLCTYERLGERYAFSTSNDKGKSYKRYYGGIKAPTPFDETMAYQKKDGTIRLMARTSEHKIAFCESKDLDNWSDTEYSDIRNPNSRFYVKRLPSGNLMLINNDHAEERINMTVYLSEDDGKTWPYRNKIDSYDSSYPDADLLGDKIIMVMDRGRMTDREILQCVFDENDIIKNNPIIPKIISKPEI